MTTGEMVEDWQAKGFIFANDPEDGITAENIMIKDIDNYVSSKPNKIIEKIKLEAKELKGLLDKGKGTWGNSDYVRDELWARWEGELCVLEMLLDKFE